MKTWKIVACLIPITLGTSIALAVQANNIGPTEGAWPATFHGTPSDHGQSAINAWLDWCATGNHQQTNPNGCVLSWTL